MARKTTQISISLPKALAERMRQQGGATALVQEALAMMDAVRSHGLRAARRTLSEDDLAAVRRAMQSVHFDASQLPVWLSGNGLAHQVEDALAPGGDLEDHTDGPALLDRLRTLDTLAQLAVILWATREGD